MKQNPRSEHVPRGYIPLSGEAEERLAAYEALVSRWAAKIDLVASGEMERFRIRHVEDSLKALPLMAQLGASSAVDVGSGAGLPGVPLAIAEPGRRWTLLEPRRKRAAFLEEVVRTLGLEVEVTAQSAEEAARSGLRFEAATARALGPPATAFDLLEPLLAPPGTAIVWVGERATLPANSALWGRGLATMPPRPPYQEETGK